MNPAFHSHPYSAASLPRERLQQSIAAHDIQGKIGGSVEIGILVAQGNGKTDARAAGRHGRRPDSQAEDVMPAQGIGQLQGVRVVTQHDGHDLTGAGAGVGAALL